MTEPGWISLEVLKIALRQTKDGLAVTFLIHPEDMHPSLLSDPIGSRYMVKLVRVDENEQPVVQSESLMRVDDSPIRKAQKNIIASAGILCRDKDFQQWLFKRRISVEPSEAGAVEGLHAYLRIHSRAQLAESQRARRAFIELRGEFEHDKENVRKGI